MGRKNNNKKRGRGSNNNKKNKGRGPIVVGTSEQQQQPNSGGSNSSNLLRIVRDLPTFHYKNHNEDPKKGEESNNRIDGHHGVGDSSGGGYYGIYKRSTTNFWVWMKRVLPNSKIVSVNDLRRGADSILENNIASIEKRKSTSSSSSSSEDFPPAPIVVPYAIMEELSTSIKYREMLTETKFGGCGEASGSGGGDEGHRFMIDVLKYCRSVLRFGRNVAKIAAMDDSNKKKKALDDSAIEDPCNNNNGNKETDNDELDTNIGGRFNALILEDQEEDEEENKEDEDFEAIENNIRQRVYPTFEPPKEPEEDIDIEQVLINGDDRLQAVALFHTMEGMMLAVDAHYELLKNYLRGQTQHDADNSIQLLMECAVASNMATESVRVAENELYANHPHIQSFYHVLALVFFPSVLADIKKKIEEASKKVDCEPKSAALEFVGDIVECSFHNRGEVKVPGKVKRFAKKSGIKLSYLEEQAKMVHLATSYETQLAMEEGMNMSLNEALKAQGQLPHSWLSESKYIGGDRCIINTQNIVQKIMGIAESSTKLVGKPGFWGPSFDENTKPAAVRIRGCLDEVFAANILPELIAKCIQVPFHKLPERSQLLTVIDLLQQYVKGYRSSPVPIALTFGLHAILTSILVLQGDGDLARLAARAKGSYNKLFSQLDAISDQSVSPENVPIFYSNVGNFKNIILFAEPATTKYDSEQIFLDPEVAEKFAFWNPVIGGEYLLYGTYFCSIGLGSATIDSNGQLRLALHLYNALKQYKQQQRHPSSSTPPLEVPIIQDIDKIFAKSKAVWVGVRPQFGSFCKNFWMSWGMSIGSATHMASAFEHINDSSSNASTMNSTGKSRRDGPGLRHLDEIYPEEYSASYKCLVQKIFTDGNADHSVFNATKETRKQHRHFYDLLTQLNITRDSMGDDERLFPMNLSVVGCILLEFANSLFKHMGWEDIIEEMRDGETMGGRKMKPGNFKASDLNSKTLGMAQVWGTFFTILDKAGSENTGVVVVPAADKAAKFMEKFFREIPRERYIFFVEKEEEEETKKASSLRNPLEGTYPRGRTGKSPREPLQGFFHFKYTKSGDCQVRMIKPGKYTPYRPTPDGYVLSPYDEKGSSKMEPTTPGGRIYRHIASYSLNELIELGWDGAMYSSKTARGNFVPFVCGYDSDDSDRYEPIDIKAGKRAGVIGLPPNEDGVFLTIPDFANTGEGRIMHTLNNPE